MDIEGTYTLQALPEDVWRCLMDAQVLRRAVPGAERLEQIDQNTYALTMHIQHPPLLGTYHGHIRVTEQQYPYHYRVIIEGEGRQSTMSGGGVVHLNRHDNNTIIAYRGTINVGKLGTLLPPTVTKGAVKLLIQQFLTALADHLRTSNHTQMIESEEILEVSTTEQLYRDPVILAPSSTAQATTTSMILRALVHWFRIGGRNPVQEEQWVNRIRRIGIVSGLVFLMWVGTRLPRR